MDVRLPDAERFGSLIGYWSGSRRLDQNVFLRGSRRSGALACRAKCLQNQNRMIQMRQPRFADRDQITLPADGLHPLGS